MQAKRDNRQRFHFRDVPSINCNVRIWLESWNKAVLRLITSYVLFDVSEQ